MSLVVTRANTTFPVIEIFGPTIQGEGPDAGRPALFVRFGGCDFRCSWCDSLYAVDPATVRAESRRLDVDQIRAELEQLPIGPSLVILSGGNPALLELGPLVARLRGESFEVAVETQGSVWRPWLADVDRLVVSPKPPSSGMAEPKHREQFADFMARAEEAGADPALKIVVFDEEDLAYAEEVASAYAAPLYLSVGTDQGLDDEATKAQLLRRFGWLGETVSRHPALAHCHVGPQLHVLAWGTARGV